MLSIKNINRKEFDEKIESKEWKIIREVEGNPQLDLYEVKRDGYDCVIVAMWKNGLDWEEVDCRVLGDDPFKWSFWLLNKEG